MPVYSYQMRHGLESQIPGNPTVLDYEPFFTTDSKELWIGLSASPNGAITPNFNDSDLTTASGTASGLISHMGRPATTRWVQNLLSSFSATPPSGVAWRTQPNTFTEANTFQKWPTITSLPLPAPDDSSQTIPTTQWVQNAISQAANGLGNVAYRDQFNTFTAINVFNDTATFNAATNLTGTTLVNGTLDATQALWNRVKTRTQQELPSYEAANTEYVWDSHLYDLNFKKSKTPPASSNDTHVATTEWVKLYSSGSNLLTSNNTWTDSNTFNVTPTTVTPPLSDNSTKIPTTQWVRNAISTLITGGAPVLTKSLISNQYNKLQWSAGTVNINGSNYSVASGDYSFPDSSTASTNGTIYYVKAELSSGSITIPPPTQSSTVASNQILLGSLTLTNVAGNEPTGVVTDPDREISGVVNAPPDYARRDLSNTFLGDNTFQGPTLTIGPNTTTTFNRTSFGNYSIPSSSSDKTLATTEWVQQVLLAGGDNYFSLTSEGNLIPKANSGFTGCLDLSSNCLLSKSPLDTKLADNTVATTQWVHSLISGLPSFPLVSLVGIVSPSSFRITWTEGMVDLPPSLNCSGPDCLDGGGTSGGDRCHIKPPIVPLLIAMPPVGQTSRKYIYVDYASCELLYSETSPNENSVGKVIAIADLNNSISPPTVVINPIQTDGWAPINSPFFTGDPKAPTPPTGDCDNSIATTQFVCDAIENALTQACGPTAQYPEIYNQNPPSLLVNVTNGTIPKPDGTLCQVSTLATPIALVANTNEYCWIRFSDCKLVASTNPPTSEQGFLLATVVTGSNHIISITKTANAIKETKISTCYQVGFGGRVFFVEEACCH